MTSRAKKSDDVEVPDTNESEAEATPTETTKVYNANDGIHGRDGGPYLDQVEQRHFEAFQAARDGGTPDFENPRGYPGIQLNTEHQQRDSYNPTTLAGDDLKDHSEFTAEPYGEVPVPVAPENDVYEEPDPTADNTSKAGPVAPENNPDDLPGEDGIGDFNYGNADKKD